MAVFCSTPIKYSQLPTIKGYNDTIGIVGINDSTPTVIYWKNKLAIDNVNENSYTHFFRITRAAGSDGSSDDDGSSAAATGDDAAAAAAAAANSINAATGSVANSINAAASSDDDGSVGASTADDGSTAADKHNTLAITNDDNYLQNQDDSKCAIHALNNLLKGEYFTTVDITDDEKNIIESPTTDVKEKIDLLKKKYYETNNKAGVNMFAVGTLLNRYSPDFFDNICGETSGSSYRIEIINIALNMFGYTTTDINSQPDNIFNELNKTDDNFVGMILNTSKVNTGVGGHYIAIRRVNNTNKFILVDSMKKVLSGDPIVAVTSDEIPLASKEAMATFISDWLAKNTNYQYISYVYSVTNDNKNAKTNFDQVIKLTSVSPTNGGRKSSTKKRRGRSASITHSSNPVVRQRYTTKRRKSSTNKRGGRRKSSTRKRR